jgi:plastocyanin
MKQVTLFAVSAVLVAGVATTTAQGTEWQVAVGAESPGRGSQALAFLPNELWIQTGDSIRWSFPTHERHTLTFLTPGQTRPPGFGPTFGVPVGCPGLTPDGSSFDGSACVTTGVLLLEDTETAASAQTYSVSFPAAGNFKFVCLVHSDMTGMVLFAAYPIRFPMTRTSMIARRRASKRGCWRMLLAWNLVDLPGAGIEHRAMS